MFETKFGCFYQVPPNRLYYWMLLWSSSQTIVWVRNLSTFFTKEPPCQLVGKPWNACGLGARNKIFWNWYNAHFLKWLFMSGFFHPAFLLCTVLIKHLSQYCVDCWSACSEGNAGGSSICADQTFVYCLFSSKTEHSTTGRRVLQTRVEETNLANSCPLIGTRYNKAASSLFHHHSSSSS